MLPRNKKNKLDGLNRSNKKDKKENIFSRNKKKIKNKIEEINKHTFGVQKLNDFIKSRAQKKKVSSFYLIKQEKNNLLFYKDNSLYRFLPKRKYDIWKQLYDKKISVEPIIDIINKKSFFKDKDVLQHVSSFDKFIENENYMLIKCKPVGMSYDLNKSHRNRPIFTIKKLLAENKIKDLKQSTKTSISRQILKIISDVWSEGVIHNHPHVGNWVIETANNNIKVRLIDFDKVRNIHHLDLKKSKDVKRLAEGLAKDVFYVSNSIKQIRNISVEKYLKKKIKNIYKPKLSKINLQILNVYLNVYIKHLKKI